MKDLHTLLMETSIASGKLECGKCGHAYAVKEGIANFLLPSRKEFLFFRVVVDSDADMIV